ncbi:MAG: hypothetical protein GXP63_02985 [DPANN group archaeon]|nr:hypothetical protein [DPANN group archaeon]
MARLSKSRRGVSPLIATVLLIAFAVALGAVVMNWGKTQIQDQIISEEECRLVKFTWFQRDGQDHICLLDDKLTMTIQNGAQREIDRLKLIVDGSTDIYVNENIIDRAIGKAEPRRISVPYDSAAYGPPVSIRLVPILVKGDRTLVCPIEYALDKGNIPTCKN